MDGVDAVDGGNSVQDVSPLCQYRESPGPRASQHRGTNRAYLEGRGYRNSARTASEDQEWKKNPQGVAQPKVLPVDFQSRQSAGNAENEIPTTRLAQAG